MSRTGHQAVIRQFNDFVNADSPYLVPLLDEADLFTWHIAVTGLSTPYTAADNAPAAEQPVFFFRLKLPENFPDKPPKLVAITPNGTYETNGGICLAFGEYHSSNWNAAFGVIGCARELFNGLIIAPIGGGIRVKRGGPTDKQKRAFGAASRQWNAKHHPGLVEAYELYCATHPDLVVARAPGHDDAVPARQYTRWMEMHTKAAKKGGRHGDPEATVRAFAALTGPHWVAGSFPGADLAEGFAAVVAALLGDDHIWDVEAPTDNAPASVISAFAGPLAIATTREPAALTADIERGLANTGVSAAAVFNALNDAADLGLDPVDE